MVIVVSVFTGCGGTEGMAGNHPISADGFPPLEGQLATIEGTIFDPDIDDELGSGCFFLKTDDARFYWVIWPEDSAQDFAEEDMRDYYSGYVKLPNGTAVNVGDRVELTGQAQTRRDLPQGDNSDSMWGALAGFCLGNDVDDEEIFRAGEARLL